MLVPRQPTLKPPILRCTSLPVPSGAHVRRIRSRFAPPSRNVAIDAPQGEVRVDRENRHCYLTPRIAVSNAAGGFDIIYEAARPVRPDPYLVWQESKGAGMRPPSLRVVK